MAPLIIYRFQQGPHERRLLFTTVSACLYTVLLDFHRDRATPTEVTLGGRRLYAAAGGSGP